VAPINERMMQASMDVKRAEFELHQAVTEARNAGDNSPATLTRIADLRRQLADAESALKPVAKEYHDQPWFYERWWKSAWSSVAGLYNDAIAAINNGTWKTALCKAAIDAGFSLVENAILAGLAAFTGGVAAAMIKIAKTAAMAGKKFTGAVRISISAKRQLKGKDGLLSVGGKEHAERSFRDIHPEKEARGAEKKLLGSDNQGTTTNTPGAGETSTKGDQKLGTKAIGNAAEEQAKKDLAAKGFTDQKTITNPQGNGVDIIARNPNTGEVMFGEVKANTARLSDVQSDLGGPEYVRDRLNRVIGRKGEWANATAQQRADAKRALEWLKQNPKFKEMKYDVDPKTGKATNYREKDWDYPEGQRPKNLKWRDGEGNEVKRKKKPKKKPTTTGPPPATPAYGPQ
jgi:hypothetical protein